jgi:hypothetical protein
MPVQIRGSFPLDSSEPEGTLVAYGSLRFRGDLGDETGARRPFARHRASRYSTARYSQPSPWRFLFSAIPVAERN